MYCIVRTYNTPDGCPEFVFFEVTKELLFKIENVTKIAETLIPIDHYPSIHIHCQDTVQFVIDNPWFTTFRLDLTDEERKDYHKALVKNGEYFQQIWDKNEGSDGDYILIDDFDIPYKENPEHYYQALDYISIERFGFFFYSHVDDDINAETREINTKFIIDQFNNSIPLSDDKT